MKKKRIDLKNGLIQLLDWVEEMWFRFRFYLMKLAYLKKRGRFRRYTLPVILVAMIFSLVIFSPIDFFQFINSQTLSLLVFISIVAISSWYGGLGPGIFATLLTAIVNFFILLGKDLPYHTRTEDLALTLLYLVIGVLISIISEARYEAEIQKDEFVGLITHELKNPLAVIKGFAGLLQKRYKKSGKQNVSKYTEEIDSQSDRMLELINDLLDVNKIEVGKFVYKDELFDFKTLAKEVISHQKIINKGREISLSGSADAIIEGDRYRIGQVITNLLTNALKYSPKKSPIEVKMKKGREDVTLMVKDYGIGIPTPEQKKVFNQYFRTRATLRGRTEGLGLGLFICKSIVNRHNGKIWVESKEGKGSTFYLKLLIKKV